MSANPAVISSTDGAVAPSQLFVINLCASTSPMALSHPSAPELKRYTFFVSRQREEGRERFRLHMGYFASQEEAEKLLEAVRDVYPAAWAGLAPTSGAPRRGRTASMPAVIAAPAPVVAAVPAPVAPVVSIAPVAPIAAVAQLAVPAPALTLAPEPAPVVAAQATAAPVEQPTEVMSVMSNVRDVLAQLSEASVPRLQPAVRTAAELDDSQVLRVLEAPVVVAAAPAAPEGESEVRVVTPEDTQTLTDIRIDAQNNAPPCFAVQLVWSVSPIDAASLPHLAIFDAYTLYNVEGNRQGRKWYGLRLGFFSDPNSATQVANYVRSDYRAVAIVPVAIKERDRAGGGAAAIGKGKPVPRLGEPLAKPAEQLALSTENLQGFELLADDQPAPKKLDLDDQPAVAAAVAPKTSKAVPPVVKPVASAAPRVAGKPGKPSGKRVVVRKRPDAPLSRAAPGAATPLESTLEILGASTLTLDEGRATINDSAVRKPLDRKSAGGNRFSKLLSRLSGN